MLKDHLAALQVISSAKAKVTALINAGANCDGIYADLKSAEAKIQQRVAEYKKEVAAADKAAADKAAADKAAADKAAADKAAADKAAADKAAADKAAAN